MKLEEWQAIAIAYGVSLLLAETEAAPLAVTMAWGIAIAYAVNTLGGHNGVSNFLSGLLTGFSKSPPPATNTGTSGPAIVSPQQAGALPTPGGLPIVPGHPNP